jgi:hypothetical protein
MENPEKLTTLGTQDDKANQKHNTICVGQHYAILSFMLCINYGRWNMTFNDFRSQSNRWFDDDVYAITVIMPYFVFCDFRVEVERISFLKILLLHREICHQ